MDVKTLVNDTNGKFFKVVFTKRDGTIRHLVGRTKVTKYLKGGTKTTPNTVITVFDVQKKQYRCFYPESVKEFKCGNISYKDGHVFIS